MDDKITISKEDLKIALFKLGSQDRFGRPKVNRIILAKYYYPDIDSGIELEPAEDEGLNQLWGLLKDE